MKKLILGLLLISLFTSCASRFKTINPENQEFSKKIETNELTIEYNPKILKYSKNTRLQKKLDKKDISFCIGKFTNKSSDSINLSKDLVFNLEIKSIDESYSKLKQKPWIYYLALISAGVAVSSEGSSGFLGINPLALIYSIPNSIIATVANKKIKKQLNQYSLENLILAPNESKYGLIVYDDLNKLNIETIKGVKVKSKTYSSTYNSFLVENCIEFNKKEYNSHQEYLNNLIQCLEESKHVRDITTFQRNYKNGNPKILGINGKHNLGNNSNYLYKIGTWAFYSEDGSIEKYIIYDVNGKEIKKQKTLANN